jgi:hypothetical protein
MRRRRTTRIQQLIKTFENVQSTEPEHVPKKKESKAEQARQAKELTEQRVRDLEGSLLLAEEQNKLLQQEISAMRKDKEETDIKLRENETVLKLSDEQNKLLGRKNLLLEEQLLQQQNQQNSPHPIEQLFTPRSLEDFYRNRIEEHEQQLNAQNIELAQITQRLEEMITIAEKLENDLASERSAHQETARKLQELESIHASRERAHLRTSFADQVAQDLEEETVSIRLHVRPSDTDPVLDSDEVQKRKSKGFFARTFSRRPQSAKFLSFSITQERRNELKKSKSEGSKKKRDSRSPFAKDYKKMDGMTDEQMREELEGLVLLGEKLSAELTSEMKRHQNTKKILLEQQALIEELRSQQTSFLGGFLRDLTPRKRKSKRSKESLSHSSLSDSVESVDLSSARAYVKAAA